MIKKDNTLFCFRCYHIWRKRKENPPKYCPNPKCHSPYWNKPRKKISKDFVLKMSEMIANIHNAIIELSGGVKGIRDEGGIYSSTYQLLNHQTKKRKNPTSVGAFILSEFAKKHHFVDGNKRTAYVVAKVFMLINSCHLRTNYSEAVKFILEIAKYESKITFEEIKKWLDENCKFVEEKDMENYLNKTLVNLIIEVNKNE